MPLDATNFAEVEADPFTLRGLIAWLETMPKDKTYCFEITCECLLAQFGWANGYPKANGGVWSILLEPGKFVSFLPATNGIASGHPRTFGAALDRARRVAKRGRR